MFIRENCNLCGDCLERCPYVEYDHDTAVEQFRRLADGETPPIVSQCVTCLACNQICPTGANPFDLILERQEQTGILNIPEQNTQLFRNMPTAPSEVIHGDVGKPTLSLCCVGDLLPGLFDGPLFEGLTILKGGDYFCNVGWVHLGAATPVREGALRFANNIALAHINEVVFYHDDCYALATSLLKEYGIEPNFRPLHIIEYLLDYVHAHADSAEPLGLKVAYQQPCASRYTPWKDQWLDELFSLIGVERVGRAYDREAALCCGSPLMPRDRERAAEVKQRNIDDAVAHGAHAMAYLCPLCVLNLRKPAEAAGLENHHLIELVKWSLGIQED
jgi:Fe-S oxidoreductase